MGWLLPFLYDEPDTAFPSTSVEDSTLRLELPSRAPPTVLNGSVTGALISPLADPLFFLN